MNTWWVNVLVIFHHFQTHQKWVRAGRTQTASCHEVKRRNERIRVWRVPRLLTAFKNGVFAFLLSCCWLFILVCSLDASCFVLMTGFKTLLPLCSITGVWSQWCMILFFVFVFFFNCVDKILTFLLYLCSFFGSLSVLESQRSCLHCCNAWSFTKTQLQLDRKSLANEEIWS